MSRLRRDDGAALVEAALLAVVLLVPVVYLVTTAAAVQNAAFAVTGAVRDAGRAYGRAGSDALGRAAAADAVTVALGASGVAWSPGDLVLRCDPAPCTHAAGSRVRVFLRVTVQLPGLPVGSIPVSARHVARLDCFTTAGTGRC